jgi:hypothetical protein
MYSIPKHPCTSHFALLAYISRLTVIISRAIEHLQVKDPTALRNEKGDVLGGIDAIRN